MIRSVTCRPFSGRSTNPLHFDDLAYADTARFHLRGIRLNFDLFADLADFQGRVDHRIRIHLQDDTGLNESPETRQRRFHSIGPSRQTRQTIRTCFICNRGSRNTCFGLRRCYFDSWQYCATLIFTVPLIWAVA